MFAIGFIMAVLDAVLDAVAAALRLPWWLQTVLIVVLALAFLIVGLPLLAGQPVWPHHDGMMRIAT